MCVCVCVCVCVCMCVCVEKGKSTKDIYPVGWLVDHSTRVGLLIEWLTNKAT